MFKLFTILFFIQISWGKSFVEGPNESKRMQLEVDMIGAIHSSKTFSELSSDEIRKFQKGRAGTGACDDRNSVLEGKDMIKQLIYTFGKITELRKGKVIKLNTKVHISDCYK